MKKKNKKKKLSQKELDRLWVEEGWAPEGDLIAVDNGDGFFRMVKHTNKKKLKG